MVFLKKASNSLAIKLILLISLSTITVFLISQIYLENSIKNHFIEFDKYELHITSNLIKKALQKRDNDKKTIDDILQIRPNMFVYIIDKMGSKVYFSNMKDYNLLPFIEKSTNNNNFVFDELQIWQNSDDFYRVFASTYENFNIFVGMNVNYHEYYIKELKVKLWIIAAISCFVLILISFFLIRFTLLPIKTISSKIEQITSKKLNTRLEDKSTPLELQSLINSFNYMLGNIEDVFKRQAKFSDDIAHELRTPISSLTTQTQIVLSKDRDINSYKEALYENLEELKRMSSMVNDMLILSMCESKKDLDVTCIDLTKETSLLLEYYDVIMEEQQVSVELQSDKNATITANKELLQRAISNLLLNAIFYATKKSTINISIKKKENEVKFKISNMIDTPIAKEDLSKIFDRFYKIDNSRERKLSGSGIGLSIVNSIVKLCGGKISVSTKDNTITFEITFDNL